MKKIKGLEGNVKDFEGKPVISQEGKFVFIKPIILQILSSHMKPGKEEVFHVMEMGRKIHGAKDELILEDADFLFVQKVITESQLSIGAIAMAPIYEMFDKAEDFEIGKINPKEKQKKIGDE